MVKENRSHLFPLKTDYKIIVSAIFLVLYGSLMIVSAEMGESSGDLSVIISTTVKQLIYTIIALIGMIFFTKASVARFRKQIIRVGYFLILGLLIITRAFGAIGGAYGWIRLGPLSLQPSELAKLYLIIWGASMFSKESTPENNLKNFQTYLLGMLVYVFIVLFWQHDLGSAFVIGIIGYSISLIPNYKGIKKYQNWMICLIVFAILIGLFLLSSTGTKLLKHFDSHYQILRFLASANPFEYQYDSGYHLIMALVSFSTGGLFGLGFGKSIHKYMNFPNPSTDFILPVIVEEMGLVFGLIPIVVAYGFILISLMKHSLKCHYIRSKIVLIGTFLYFSVHFILNIGGVSGLIPLTGVPLLLISAGGSSLISCMCALGLAESEIIYYRNKQK